MIPRMCVLGVVLLACGTLYANIGPDPEPRRSPPRPAVPPTPGYGIAPQDRSDLKGLEIQMVSEQVDLTLVREDRHSFLDVEVTFMMKNHSKEDVTIGVCCPIGERNNVQGFEAETDGLVHETTLQARRAGQGYGRKATVELWFYDWEATFLANQYSIVKVKYRHDLKGATSTGYTVSSGSAWKGRIEKSIITLSGSEEAWSFIRRIGPSTCREVGKRIVWSYKDYDPTPQHDISISYNSQTLTDEIEALQPQLNHWEQRCEMCTLLKHAHYSSGRLSNDAAQWRALRHGLMVLLREAKADGDKIVMPRNDGEWVPAAKPEDPPRWVDFIAVRAYAMWPGARNVLSWLSQVRLVIDALPHDPETEAFRQAWLAVVIAGSVGRLYAGDQAMQSTEEQRAEWAKAAVELNARAR